MRSRYYRIVRKLSQFRCYSSFQYEPLLLRDTWEPVVGLEIHAQISSVTKLFTRVATAFGAPPNTQVGIFEAAHPGTLPVLNKRCVEAGIKTALALGASINKVSCFDRKHYFYPDLPAGYQITQSEQPLASNGRLEFHVNIGGRYHRQTVDLVQLQLEEDSGKSIHDMDNNRVLIDLNRAGQPLMELVFSPNLRSGEEAAAMVKEVAHILTTVKTCDCHMHEGSLRVDANISVHKVGEPLGTRTEVKNIGSLQALERAVNFEINRQMDILESGGTVNSETRSFDVFTNETISMRDKEVTHDYRFMPEPNLLPLRLHDSAEKNCKFDGSLDIDVIRASMPELPEATRQRLIKEYGLNLETVIRLMSQAGALEYFMGVMSEVHRSPVLICNLLFNDLTRILNIINADITSSPLSQSAFGELVDLRQSDSISSNVVQEIIKLICIEKDARTPKQIVLDNDWMMVSDKAVLDGIVEMVLTENPKMVNQYQRQQSKKKKKTVQALNEMVRQASGNKANMSIVHNIILKKLET